MVKKCFKYLFITLIGVSLAFLYSYIIKHTFNVETIIVFCCLYAYMILFIKFLIRLFK